MGWWHNCLFRTRLILNIFKVQSYVISLLIILLLCSNLTSGKELLSFLQNKKNIQYSTVDSCTTFSEKYIISVKQPVNHNDTSKGWFMQRVVISHSSVSSPVVFVTEGYNAKYAEAANYKTELTDVLNSNQIIVEHRYFGKSTPESINWEYLTIEQACKDLHEIKLLFSEFYKGKWISTGISKGGQTALCYKYFFPNDVDASLTYVTPLVTSQADKRIDNFLENIGTKECRDKIFNFQQNMLRKKKLLLDILVKSFTVGKLNISIDPEIIFDYMILEFPFSFWQWGGVCEEIPSVDKVNAGWLRFLGKIINAFNYSDEAIKDKQSSFYMLYSELGYYKYNITPFQNYLKASSYSNEIFFPKNVKIKYNPELIENVSSYLKTKGNRIIYIYGEYDPWTSCSVDLGNNVESIKIVQAGGNHSARINNLSADQKEQVYVNLEHWLGIKVNRKK